MTNPTNPTTIDELITTANTVKFVGERLLQSSFEGYEAKQAVEAIEFVSKMFADLDQQIMAHPDYNDKVAEKNKASK